MFPRNVLNSLRRVYITQKTSTNLINVFIYRIAMYDVNCFRNGTLKLFLCIVFNGVGMHKETYWFYQLEISLIQTTSNIGCYFRVRCIWVIDFFYLSKVCKWNFVKKKQYMTNLRFCDSCRIIFKYIFWFYERL